MKQLPEPRGVKTGTIVTVKRISYEKKINGRWGVVWDEALLSKARKLYSSGLTLKEVVGVLNPSLQVKLMPIQLQSVAKAGGWIRSKTRRDEALNSFLRSNAKKLLTAHTKYGVYCSELADMVGVSRACVEKLAKQAGLPVGRKRYEDVRSVQRPAGVLTHESRSLLNELLDKDYSGCSFKDYRTAVRKLTNIVLMMYPTLVPRSSRTLDQHLDHAFSIYNGFWDILSDGSLLRRDTPIPLNLICHPENLRLVSRSENCSKRGHSTLSLQDLKKRVKKSGITVSKANREEELARVAKKLNIKPFKEPW